MLCRRCEVVPVPDGTGADHPLCGACTTEKGLQDQLERKRRSECVAPPRTAVPVTPFDLLSFELWVHVFGFLDVLDVVRASYDHRLRCTLTGAASPRVALPFPSQRALQCTASPTVQGGVPPVAADGPDS